MVNCQNLLKRRRGYLLHPVDTFTGPEHLLLEGRQDDQGDIWIHKAKMIEYQGFTLFY